MGHINAAAEFRDALRDLQNNERYYVVSRPTYPVSESEKNIITALKQFIQQLQKYETRTTFYSLLRGPEPSVAEAKTLLSDLRELTNNELSYLNQNEKKQQISNIKKILYKKQDYRFKNDQTQTLFTKLRESVDAYFSPDVSQHNNIAPKDQPQVEAQPSKSTQNVTQAPAIEVTFSEITEDSFNLLASQVQNLNNQRAVVSLESLEQELAGLRQNIAHSSGVHFTVEDKHLLQARISEDRAKEALLAERYVIRQNPGLDTYYQTIQTHFSELMVASLGIASGYIKVKNSNYALAAGWIGTAIESVFPRTKMIVEATTASINFVDAECRKAFLSKIKIFQTTVTEAEILGEQVARLLTRAHYHAQHDLSSKQAAQDAQAIISFITAAHPPLVRDTETAITLFKAAWGDKEYSLEPILSNEPQKNEIDTTATITRLLSPPPIVLRELENTTSIPPQADYQQLLTEFAQLKQQLMRLEGKSRANNDVVGKGGQALCMISSKPEDEEVKESQERMEKRLAAAENQIVLLTERVLLLTEENLQLQSQYNSSATKSFRPRLI